MRVLIDECLPKQLKGWLAGKHDAVTVHEMGWASVKNGKLLRAANEVGFDVFVTADKNMYYQQNFDGLRISAVGHPEQSKASRSEERSGIPPVPCACSTRPEGCHGSRAGCRRLGILAVAGHRAATTAYNSRIQDIWNWSVGVPANILNLPAATGGAGGLVVRRFPISVLSEFT